MRSSNGSVMKLGKDYYRVQVELGRDVVTGKRMRVTRRVRGSRRTAEKVMAELLVQAGAAPVVSSMTFAQYVEMVFLPRKAEMVERTRRGEAHGRNRFKQTTYDAYEARLRLHVTPHIGDVPLMEIGAREVRAVQDAQATEAAKVEARKVMGAVFKEAVYDELMGENPVTRVRPPDPGEYQPDLLDEEDIDVYLWHFRGTRSENVVLLALGGAYRRGELAAMDAEDVDLDTGVVSVGASMVPTSKGVIEDTPKNHKARTNVLPGFILERLRETLPESGPVARTLDGRRLKPDMVSRLYLKELKTLPEGVPRVTLKNLRHTALTLVFDATGDMEAAAMQGGHSSQSTSRKYYVRPHEAPKRRVAEKVDEFARERGLGGLRRAEGGHLAPDGTTSGGEEKGLSEERPGQSWCPQRESNPCLSLERAKWVNSKHPETKRWRF